jgi:hypothetical protein
LDLSSYGLCVVPDDFGGDRLPKLTTSLDSRDSLLQELPPAVATLSSLASFQIVGNDELRRPPMNVIGTADSAQEQLASIGRYFRELPFAKVAAIFGLVISATSTETNNGVAQWLQILAARCPGAVVFPVVTKAACVDNSPSCMRRISDFMNGTVPRYDTRVQLPPIGACASSLSGIGVFRAKVVEGG